MRLCLAHNFYRSRFPSGENAMVRAAASRLMASGELVGTIFASSDRLESASASRRMTVALRMTSHAPRVAAYRARLATMRPDLVHLHNPWPLMTWDVAVAARELGIPSVQTLHNYRLAASETRFIENGGTRRPANAIEAEELYRMRALYGSRLQNACYQRAIANWRRRDCPLDRLICLTDFQRRLMTRFGLPEERLVVVPNGIAGGVPRRQETGDRAIFIGRSSPEKGLAELLAVWPATRLPLTVVGVAAGDWPGPPPPEVTFAGHLPRAAVLCEVARSRLLVMNSTCYEVQPTVLVEALAAGVPCLVPDLGAMPEMVDRTVCGAVFAPGSAEEIIAGAADLWRRSPDMMTACRNRFEEHYEIGLVEHQLRILYQSLTTG